MPSRRLSHLRALRHSLGRNLSCPQFVQIGERMSRQAERVELLLVVACFRAVMLAWEQQSLEFGLVVETLAAE